MLLLLMLVVCWAAVGCANLEPPADAWVERTGDRTTVSCNKTSQSWHLVCKGTTWVGPHTHDCRHGLSLDLYIAAATVVAYRHACTLFIACGLIEARQQSVNSRSDVRILKITAYCHSGQLFVCSHGSRLDKTWWVLLLSQHDIVRPKHTVRIHSCIKNTHLYLYLYPLGHIDRLFKGCELRRH